MAEATQLVGMPRPQDTPTPVPESFWDEIAGHAPKVWLVTAIAALIGNGMAFAGDLAALPAEHIKTGLALRTVSQLYFAVGLWLGLAAKPWVSKHYRALMMGVFPAITIPVSLNGHWAGANGDLYWFGILQLQLGASTFFSIPTPLFLAGAWLSNLAYVLVRIGWAQRPPTNNDVNVVIGLVIFGFLASVTHYVILSFRRESHAQRHQLYVQHRQKTQILSSITDAFFALDRDWRVVYMNAAAEKIMANLRPAGSMLSRQLWEEFPGLADSLMHDEFHRAVQMQTPVSYEEFYPLLDREVEVKAFPAHDGLSVYFHDVTDLKRTQKALEEARDNLEARVQERTQALQQALAQLQEEAERRQTVSLRLQSSLAEKEVLLREVHHRSKNNMQVLSSLIRLQAESVQNESDRLAFRESEHRIRAMALVHEKLYQSNDLSHVDLSAYLRELIHQLVPAYASRPIQLKVDAQGVRLGIDAAVAIGLIASELVTNALRHAFAQVERPTLDVLLRWQDDSAPPSFVLDVIDNGCGLPKDYAPERATSLGFQLVRALANNQLGGTVEVDSTPQGTRVSVRFRESR